MTPPPPPPKKKKKKRKGHIVTTGHSTKSHKSLSATRRNSYICQCTPSSHPYKTSYSILILKCDSCSNMRSMPYQGTLQLYYHIGSLITMTFLCTFLLPSNYYYYTQNQCIYTSSSLSQFSAPVSLRRKTKKKKKKKKIIIIIINK